ncbi:MAG: F0F1 ATP synthase subunit gamma, partial [Alphaproteobacteria bacterium HGW-Alphaproteobacteria-2]
MPSLKDLKLRIDSVKSTRKITKAMQMVAAAKLRRAQEAAEAARPYAERMSAVMANVAATAQGRDGAPKLLAGTGADQTHLLVVMTSERGLCGGFNSSIVKLARARIEALARAGKTVKILTVGKKAREQLKRDHAARFVGHVDLSEVKRLGYENAHAIARDLLTRFDAGEFDVATLYFNTFKSVISQIPTERQVIPVKVDADAASGTLYDYEPDEEEVLRNLLPRGVATQVFTALLENGASEQGARMSAMDNATRNAGEMIDKLTI